MDSAFGEKTERDDRRKEYVERGKNLKFVNSYLEQA